MVKNTKESYIECTKCGKMYNKVGIKMHQKWCKGSNDTLSNMGDVSDVLKKSIDEVNFMEESNKSKADISPKDEYGCPKCNAVFGRKSKFCPECGQELSWD